MPTKLEEARSLLVTRLEELDRERQQLLEAIGQLDNLVTEKKASGGASKRRAATRSNGADPTKSAKRSSTSRKRAPRGEREKQLLMSIKTNPDYRVSEHAREVGVSPQQLYPLLNRLVARDAIEKKDKRYAVKAG